MFLALKVAKEGYYGGNPEQVLNAPVNLVMDILNYESTMTDYLEMLRKMNEEN